MTEYTYEQVMKALRNADAAGDVDAARQLARIADQKRQARDGGLMGQLNRGIAEGAGGLIDLFNPFDKPHALNPFKDGTGSAAEGLAALMNSAGIATAQGAPETFTDAVMRGAGRAAGALPAAAAGGQTLSQAPGMAGRIAGDMTRALSTRAGIAAEVAAGGVSGGAEKVAENMGAPEWAQTTAAILAPAAIIPAATAAPVMRATAGAVKRHAAPYTRSGATEVARQRLQSLAGGPERAEALAGRLDGDNPLQLTPAQQMQDPNMLALERLAADQDPNVREALAERARASQAAARAGMQSEGDTEAARQFFEDRRRAFSAELKSRAGIAMRSSEDEIRGVTNAEDPSVNSARAYENLRRSLDDARTQEAELWDRVPEDTLINVGRARDVAASWQTRLGRAKSDDLPAKARELLIADDGYTDAETVREVYNLYSEMREVARNAKAGNNQRRTLAKVANEIADALLEDLGAKAGTTEVGARINEARAYSAALHETFDRGAPGRLLKVTIDGDNAIDPELSLKRTIGREGTEAAVASRQLEAAGVETRHIQDFIAGMFSSSAVSPQDGAITPGRARAFTARNKELLDRYPELKTVLNEAVARREAAQSFAARVEKRLSQVRDERLSATERFIGGNQDKAFDAVFSAEAPQKVARRLANEARKDRSGQAMDGVKSSFSRVLIDRATSVRGGTEDLSSDKLLAFLEAPKNKGALRAIYTEQELSRMRHIARELAKLKAASGGTPYVGESLSGSRPSRIIEYALRVVAARQGADLGGGGGASLQTAQMASSRMKDALSSLTNDRASQMIADAITDPKLFAALLARDLSPTDAKASLLLPYLVGGTAAAMTGE